MKRDKRRARAGFTLIEIVAVLAITAIFAAIAAPSMLGFLDTGRQTNRGNIARTVYLGAQNRLTELKITKNLNAFLTSHSVGIDSSDKVFEILGTANLPEEDSSNDGNIRYISKSGGSDPGNPVTALLAPVILDSTILNGAILIEFNIQTGVVLSVFYSDTLAGEFNYDDKDNGLADIYGARPYPHAYERGQGYYGIGKTGTLTETPEPAVINIYDSYTKKLPDDPLHINKNVLYAEILIPASQMGNSFDLLINDKTVEPNVPFVSLFGTLNEALLNVSAGGAIVYRHDAGAPDEYARIIWVLDYVGGNMLDGSFNASHSIGKKYDNKALPDGGTLSISVTSNIRVGIQGSVSATSVTEAHPYFFTENNSAYGSGNFTVKSARHLYNIRNMPGGKFTQRDNIDLADITNFKPIPSLTGSYNGTGWAIKNLTINMPSTDNVGLFDTVGAGVYVTGLTLEDPNVSGGTNTGSVCGTLEGVITGAYVRYTDAAFDSSTDTVKKFISGGGNVGGIVGFNDDGILTDSTFISNTPGIHISGVTVGGIVGNNSANGRLQRLMFLALAPANGTNINPIVGTNSASASYLNNLYYLSGTTRFPTSMVGLDYNTETAVVGEKKGTYELYNLQSTSLSSWSRKATLTSFEALSPDNDDYPYPYSKYTTNNIVPDSRKQWPIAGDVSVASVNTIVYYEKYTGTGGYGFWADPAVGSGVGINTLKGDGNVIVEAGYAVILDKDLPNGYYFDAKNAGSTVRITDNLKALSDSSLAGSAKDALKAKSIINDAVNIWAFVLPLQNLYNSQTRSTPLEVSYTVPDGGVTVTTITYMQPLFAKGLYSSASVPDNEFYIRTPWQMKNISKLTVGNSGTDYTNGHTFIQERNLNFADSGAGVHSADGSGGTAVSIAVVDNVFKGTYDGGEKTISNVAINGSEYSGLFSQNSGTIKDCRIIDINISGGTNKVGGVVGVNSALIVNTSVENFTFSGNQEIGGIAGINEGNSAKIDNCKVIRLNVSSSTQPIGGIVGVNSALIVNTQAENITIAGNGQIGGIAGRNEGTSAKIENCKVTGFTISSVSSDVGGVAGKNSAPIIKTNVENSNISARDTLGGIAGSNTSDIEACKVIGVEISGNNVIGGIAGSNGGSSSKITSCRVTNVNISGKDKIGGVAGENSSVINKTGVEYSTVEGSEYNSLTGGIVGISSGPVEDVFFLSINEIDNVPVSNNGGGIVGTTSVAVTRALYLAPAPSSVSGGVTTIYPIVRTCAPGLEAQNSFYLSGHRYSTNEGKNWINTPYNRGDFAGTTVEPSGGGIGLTSDFIGKGWLRSFYGIELSKWEQPSSRYPYPVLDYMYMTAPSKYPLTDSPARPDQEEVEGWEETLPPSDRALNLNFINANFGSPLMNPANPTELYNLLGNNPGGFNTAGNPAAFPERDGSNYNNMYTYYRADWVQGWNTRPVDPANKSNQFWNAIEFQRPFADASWGRVRTNYDGTLDGVYAELNAEVPGTLYQICATRPGSEMYYSFYHAKRGDGGYQRMNFYLSGMVNQKGEWVYSDGTGKPTIIRPCITPRRPTNATAGAATTRNTVVYGTTSNNDNDLNVGKVMFYDPKIKKQRTAYLIDVWVGDSSKGEGYGITFWTDTLPDATTPIGTATNRIPSGGVVNITTPKSVTNPNCLPQAILAAAQNNVVGYWHVAQFGGNCSEWKQYYGLYTIPDGQVTTEFAYESASNYNAQEGNYLNGITFQSPGFLSIDKYAKMNNADVMYVKPGDTVQIELNVKNWGEVSVGNIVVTDQLKPFDKYISYVDNTVVVKKNNIPLTEATASLTDGVLTVKLPAGITLATNEEVKITFYINVLNYVKSPSGVSTGVSTMLYYFKNQAVVEYTDASFANGYTGNISGYNKTVKKNASEPVQVHIDPIKLTKKVESVTPPTGGSDTLIDGPFKVTLRIEDTLGATNSITTTGLVNDLIPKGFEILDRGNLPLDSYATNADDGFTRITINGVNLGLVNNVKVKVIEYYYTLKYTGNGYGVAYTNAEADYKYRFIDESNNPLNVVLKFPQPVVGISVKTEDCNFTAAESGVSTFNIVGNSFDERLLADKGYEVRPEVVLVKKDSVTLAQKNPNGDYQINDDSYTATLLRSNHELLFEPKPGASGTYEFYYEIRLTATKSDATPARFELSSNLKKITVTINGTGTTPTTPPASGTGSTP